MQAEILSLFAVPLGLTEDLLDAATNAELATWVLRERAADAGVQRSNVGGWHSRPDLPNRGAPALDVLFAALIEQVRSMHGRLSRIADFRARYMLQAWATVLEHGDYMQVHDHADAHWSVVYYVDVGDSDDPASGRISWINPVDGHRSLPGVSLVQSTFACTPRTGLLVVFPGWLRHTVEPYRGSRPRIVIAANIEVQAVRD